MLLSNSNLNHLY